MTAAALFLDVDELRTLTGRCAKAQQIAALKTMAVPFYVNAAGRPVVVRAAIEGRPAKEAERPTTWSPRLVSNNR